MGVDMPNVNRTILSSKEQPFLAVKLSMDKLLGAQLCAEMPKPNRHAATVHCGMAVAPASVALLEAVARLVDLLDKPEQAPVLAPMYIREIHYHTLAGPLGETMRAFAPWGPKAIKLPRPSRGFAITFPVLLPLRTCLPCPHGGIYFS